MTSKISTHTRALCQNFVRRYALPPEADEQMMKIVDGHVAALAGHRRTLVERWAEQTRADPEIGRNALSSTLSAARRAVERFGGDRLKKALEETGVGNHPEVIRAFSKVGRAMAAAAPSTPRRKPTREDAMRALYPSMSGPKI